MSTLAYYSNLIKKENIMERIHLDTEELANIANDLVCELKFLSSSCKNKNIEDALENLTKSEEIVGILNVMIKNSRENIEAYVSSMMPQKKEAVETQETLPNEEKKDSGAGQNLNSLVETLKSLKEMQQSLDNK